MLTALAAETALLRSRLDLLTRQVASGQKAASLGDLAPEVPRAVSLRAELGRREVYGRAMSQAVERIEVTQTTLGRLRSIAHEFRTQVAMRLSSADPHSLETVCERARAALGEVGLLLNARHAGEYLFGGGDFGNPPVPDPQGLAAGGMATGIAAAVASLAPGNGATVAAGTLAVAATDASPFSAYVASFPAGAPEPRRAVPSGDGELIPYGLHADRNTASSSTGETTGGWARDLLRGLMTLASLTPASLAAGGDFDMLVASVRDGFKAAEDALGEESGSLGLVQARIAGAKGRHEAIGIALKTQLAGIHEVDLAESLTRLQATRTNLEASYRAIASLSDLSLARFLR